MGSVCADHHHHHHHKFHPLISPKKSLQDLNIPPRKLLSRRSDISDCYSPSSDAAAALMHKFLPCNGDSSPKSDNDFDSDDDPYSSDEFRMYEFKIRKCTRSRSHDWTDCPFSHPGEKARRRDPRRFHYSGTICPEYRRTGGCTRGDECEFAHGVFECWLHPARYRTEACKDGKNCKRKVCFFAHSPRELRVLPVEDDGDDKHHKHQLQQQQCCKYCCTLSPTSILGMSANFSSPPISPSLSPPMSPMKAMTARGLAGLTRYSDRVSACGSKGLSYEDMVIADILGSFDGMNLSETLSPNKQGRGLWVDVNGYDDNGIADDYVSPSVFSSRNLFTANSDSSVSGAVFNTINNNGAVEDSPDLGWVNELLM
ncbi:zinc finger CCCH domain-containing protein 2-like [Amaranthus tricolor]|uniref:zinc finger CCCH domain-containing protein 2-like n=1 Tax=Amaranthus tricolor TaxID=29722 RepID=UPI00259052E8|nr:zinc finger CCCH domain-containing protein 2-like [Amaranthus tricolor]